jgi:hypothetical protein
LLLNFVLEYAIRSVQKNRERLKLNGTHQHLAYADDDLIVGKNTDTIKKSTEALLDANKEVGLEMNPEKNRSKLMSPNQKHRMKTANRSFEDVGSSNIWEQH